ncbi:MAG: hypothetical protein HXY50_08120 [Ignavibacteriaceae bacterium]|nr:hypothetical protein [Ignavibacteriaceae bacterium]
MKTFNYKILNIAVIIFTMLVITTCREEVISPRNNSGNINEPYKSSIRNSYTFILNAENLSQLVVDYPTINYFSSRIFISVLDYSSGSFEVVLFTKSREIVYSTKLSEESSGKYASVDGVRPEIVEFKFNNFSGKLKFQLTGVL